MFLFRDFIIRDFKEIRISLNNVYGISWYKSALVSTKIGLSNPYFNNLNDYYINFILYLLKGLVLSDVRIKRIISNNIYNIVILNSYRGSRHRLYLPARGQRTRTNAGVIKNIRRELEKSRNKMELEKSRKKRK